MSSPNLAAIRTQLNLYLYPFFTILGCIGNILILILFSRQRQSACSIYIMTSAVANIVYLLSSAYVPIFGIYDDGTIRALILCKMGIYVANVTGQVTKTMLILACIDRYLITSKHVHFRAFSTPKRAKYLVLFSIIFWLIASSHIAIMTIFVNGQCTRVGTYATIFNVYTILVVGLIPSTILCVFGYLTYRNRRQLHNRIQPTGQDTNNANPSIKRRDRDLLIIVISEVFVYIITTSLFPLVLLEMLITQYTMPNKSLQYFQAEFFTWSISLLLLFAFSAAPFYTYVISSKAFRREFKQLIINSYRKLTRQPPVQTTSRSDQAVTLKQRDTQV